MIIYGLFDPINEIPLTIESQGPSPSLRKAIAPSSSLHELLPLESQL